MSVSIPKKMPQTKAAAALLDNIESIRYVDLVDLLDRAEEIARSEGALRVDDTHVAAALETLAGVHPAKLLAS